MDLMKLFLTQEDTVQEGAEEPKADMPANTASVPVASPSVPVNEKTQRDVESTSTGEVHQKAALSAVPEIKTKKQSLRNMVQRSPQGKKGSIDHHAPTPRGVPPTAAKARLVVTPPHDEQETEKDMVARTVNVPATHAVAVDEQEVLPAPPDEAAPAPSHVVKDEAQQKEDADSAELHTAGHTIPPQTLGAHAVEHVLEIPRAEIPHEDEAPKQQEPAVEDEQPVAVSPVVQVETTPTASVSPVPPESEMQTTQKPEVPQPNHESVSVAQNEIKEVPTPTPKQKETSSKTPRPQVVHPSKPATGTPPPSPSLEGIMGMRKGQTKQSRQGERPLSFGERRAASQTTKPIHDVVQGASPDLDLRNKKATPRVHKPVVLEEVDEPETDDIQTLLEQVLNTETK